LLLRATYVFFGRRYFGGQGDNLQSLTLGIGSLLVGFLIFLIGLVSDRIGGIRRLQEENLYRQRRAELENSLWRKSIETRLNKVEDPLDKPR
jgi:hypothetical protein